MSLSNLHLNESQIKNLVGIIKSSIVYDPLPSPPGSPPFAKTGELVNSIREIKRNENEYDILGTEYALYLEYGTINMAPRPFIRPAINIIKNELVKDLIKQIKEK